MNRLNRHVHLLHVLAGASPAQRKAILKNASNDQIKTLCEICQNLLSGNIATNNIKKLCSYKRVIRLLADRSVPISRKRKLFTTNRQVGGFLPLVLPAVLSLIGGLVGPELPIQNIPEVPQRINMLAKYIGYVVPKVQKKYILPILEKLKDANYTFNDKNELEINGKPEYRSNAIDLFSYIMKNDRSVLTPPKGFNKFFTAIHDSNIPLQWIEQGSFGGVERLSNASGLRRRDVQKWLSQQDVYTLHKPVRYKFQRRKTIAYKRYPTIPPTYALQDFNSKEIDGRFYNEELQKIDKSTNGYWAIEKIIQTKGRGPSRRLFVKWVGFPDSQNSWIRADQIELRHNESECK
ncbi:uncharacterized protein TNCV_1897171 [Trichonephila clavipes]|nr:uncharacterized protein TNCV_1897171 [Trichonephila clavipes]